MRTPKPRDVLDCLKEAIAEDRMRSGTGDSDVNVFAIPYPVPYGVIKRAIAELEHLRSVAGAVTRGTSFAEIKAGHD